MKYIVLEDTVGKNEDKRQHVLIFSSGVIHLNVVNALLSFPSCTLHLHPIWAGFMRMNCHGFKPFGDSMSMKLCSTAETCDLVKQLVPVNHTGKMGWIYSANLREFILCDLSLIERFVAEKYVNEFMAYGTFEYECRGDFLAHKASEEIYLGSQVNPQYPKDEERYRRIAALFTTGY